jgi:hypothetical protein
MGYHWCPLAASSDEHLSSLEGFLFRLEVTQR